MMSFTLSKKNNSLTKYVIVTLICAVFSIIYEIFSHQVYSPFMVGLFAIPLILGVFPALLFKKINRDLWQKTIQSFAIATLIAGSALQGIMDIYGTTNNYIIYFWIVGLILLGISLIMIIRDYLSNKAK